MFDIDMDKELDFHYLIYSANGSPGKILENIQIWTRIPKEIKNNLHFPLHDNLKIFEIAKLISEQLEIQEQIFLINVIQNKWWDETKNSNIIKNLEDLKSHINKYIQPRLAWEVILLKISLETF